MSRELWCHVLQRAVVDAGYVGVNTENLHEKRHAHAWIAAGGPDFQRVCTMAGVDAEYFRDQYLKGAVLHRVPRGRQAKELPEDFTLTLAAE